MDSVLKQLVGQRDTEPVDKMHGQARDLLTAYYAYCPVRAGIWSLMSNTYSQSHREDSSQKYLTLRNIN